MSYQFRLEKPNWIDLKREKKVDLLGKKTLGFKENPEAEDIWQMKGRQLLQTQKKGIQNKVK